MAVTALQAFTNNAFGTIRTMESDGKIYFCGQDFATALDYKNPINAIKAAGMRGIVSPPDHRWPRSY